MERPLRDRKWEMNCWGGAADGMSVTSATVEHSTVRVDNLHNANHDCSVNSSTRNSVVALPLAALLGTAGSLHFAKPEFFDAIVPDWMPGEKRTTTLISGAAEIAVAALIAIPRTRRLGGQLAALTFAAVFPANIQAALDGGMTQVPPPLNSAAAAWARLPLQIPLIAWARRIGTAQTT